MPQESIRTTTARSHPAAASARYLARIWTKYDNAAAASRASRPDAAAALTDLAATNALVRRADGASARADLPSGVPREDRHAVAAVLAKRGVDRPRSSVRRCLLASLVQSGLSAEPDARTPVLLLIWRLLGACAVTSQPTQIIGVQPQSYATQLALTFWVGRLGCPRHIHRLGERRPRDRSSECYETARPA